VRPRVTDGGGGKAGNDDGDMGEGAEQATLSACGKRTAVEEADSYGAESATSRVGECFGTQLPATLHTSVLGTTAAGPSASVRPRVTDDGGGNASDGDYEDDRSG
jgi:hypothetical protein